MQISRSNWLGIGGGILIAALAGAGLWYFAPQTGIPASPATESPAAVAATSSPAAAISPAPKASPIAKFPINPADTIVSWSFKGAYAGNDTLIANANADKELLTGLLGKGTYDDYDLYDGIANDDTYLGDGALAYQNYNRSITIHPTKGLAYMNLGHLMDQLGAYHTAADAYAKAVAVEPTRELYRTAQLDFLTERFPEQAALLKAKQ